MVCRMITLLTVLGVGASPLAAQGAQSGQIAAMPVSGSPVSQNGSPCLTYTVTINQVKRINSQLSVALKASVIDACGTGLTVSFARSYDDGCKSATTSPIRFRNAASSAWRNVHAYPRASATSVKFGAAVGRDAQCTHTIPIT